MLLRALALGPVIREPLRTAVTVLGVAGGVAAVVATVAASRAAVVTLEADAGSLAGQERIEISSPGGVPVNLLAVLRPLAGDAVVTPVIEEVALLPTLGDTVRVLGLDVLVDPSLREGSTDVPSHRQPDALLAMVRGDGVLLPSSLARRLGVTTGGTVGLVARGRPVELGVVATFTPHRLAAAWERVVIVDVALAQRLFGRLGMLDRIELAPRDGMSLPTLERRARELVGSRARVSRPHQRREELDRMVAALRFNLTALSGVSLLVGSVLVATTLATSVVQRRSQFALARSLGASRFQLAAAVLVEAAVIGIVGGLLGLALGRQGGQAALAAVRTTVATTVRGAPLSEVELPAWLAALGVALAIMTAMAAAVLPVVEAAASPPLQALARRRPESLGRLSARRTFGAAAVAILAAIVLVRLPAWGGFPVPALLGCLAILAALMALAAPTLDGVTYSLPILFGPTRAMARLGAGAVAAGRRRAAWAVGAVGVSVALAVAVATMVQSFRATVIWWTDQAMGSDLWVRAVPAATGVPAGRLDPAIVEIAVRLFGTQAVDPFHSIRASFRGKPVTFAGGAMAVAGTRGGVPFRDGRDSRRVFAAALARGAALVNEPFANRFGVGEGDTITLAVAGRVVSFVVEGVYYDYSNYLGTVVVDRARFLSLVPDAGPQQIAVFLPEHADPARARARLLRALGGRFVIEVMLNRDLRSEILATFDRTFAITTALRLVAAAVAVLAVLTVLYALLYEQRKELGVLRALGASRSQTCGFVLTQGGMIGFSGALLGFAAGLAIGVVLVKVVNLQSFGWTMRLVAPWPSLVATSGAVAVACFLAGLPPALAAARSHPREVLHEDG